LSLLKVFQLDPRHVTKI